MHAASVHPEPGSNSRYHCIKTCVATRFNLYIELLLLAFYFCLSSILVWIVRDPLHILYMLCTSLLLFNFQGSFAAACATAWLLYHNRLALSIPFWKVFYFFSRFFSRWLRFATLLSDSLHIIPQAERLVKYFFTKKQNIFQHFHQN